MPFNLSQSNTLMGFLNLNKTIIHPFLFLQNLNDHNSIPHPLGPTVIYTLSNIFFNCSND